MSMITTFLFIGLLLKIFERIRKKKLKEKTVKRCTFWGIFLGTK